MTVRESLLTGAAIVLLVLMVWAWRSYGAPAEQVVVTPTPTLAVTILPETPTVQAAGPPTTRTLVPTLVREMLLLTPSATPLPAVLILPTDEPTPTATAVKTMQQKG